MKKILVLQVTALILALTIMVGTSVSASAYQLKSFRHKSSKIYYYYDNWTALRAKSYFSTGAKVWKAATTEATINYYSSNSNSSYYVYMSAGSISDVSWDGMTYTTYNTSTNYVTSQTVTLNTAKRAWNDDDALQSVIVHEMGHVFGLADNGKTSTIMNGYTYGTNSRYGEYKLMIPQKDDIDGVNKIY